MKYLVTGAAGFIGFHTSRRLCHEGHQVVGIDNLDPYYEISLKQARLQQLESVNGFSLEIMDISDQGAITGLFDKHNFDRVIHLAAQAGVRYSLENPQAYINSNIIGFTNILEACRHNQIKHLIYASSSSVYGLNRSQPYSTADAVDHPVSLYAASKRSNELMAHSYSHLFGLPATGLRFFTVYGPWGRPDMAYFSFTKKILEGEKIRIFNHGNMSRDLTYVDDIVEGIIRIAEEIPSSSDVPSIADGIMPPHSSSAPFRVYNIGNNQPVRLMDMVSEIERATGRKAKLEFAPMQSGDVHSTWADIDDLFNTTGYSPDTSFSTGIDHFVQWYRNFYC
ncbi:NAD-dependent epimerase [Spongorhabdus nitratireducens]